MTLKNIYSLGEQKNGSLGTGGGRRSRENFCSWHLKRAVLFQVLFDQGESEKGRIREKGEGVGKS